MDKSDDLVGEFEERGFGSKNRFPFIERFLIYISDDYKLVTVGKEGINEENYFWGEELSQAIDDDTNLVFNSYYGEDIWCYLDDDNRVFREVNILVDEQGYKVLGDSKIVDSLAKLATSTIPHYRYFRELYRLGDPETAIEGIPTMVDDDLALQFL